MGDRMNNGRALRAQRENEQRAEGLACLGEEVSTSLETARRARGDAARVRSMIVSRETPRLRLANATSGVRMSDKGGWLSLSSTKTRVAFGVLAFAAVAAGVVLALRAPSDQGLQARKDPSHQEHALSFTTSSDNKPGMVGAFIAATSDKETPVTFSDGSKLRLEPSARVRVAEVANTGARVHLESGTVHVAVVHRDEATKWAVEAGPYEVAVTGTKFDVVWDPSTTGLVVKLDEGSVIVRGCGQDKHLKAGEELRVACDPPKNVVATEDNNAAPVAVPAPVVHAPPPTTPVAVAPPTAPSVVVAGPANVIALARRGAHADALSAAERNGFSATCDALEGPDLLVLADAARYAGRFDRAREALETTRRRFGGSDAAATAAFELGRIEMDVRNDLVGAGDHFEAYLRERPQGSLAREALGRAIEARNRAGDTTRAERLAVRYLAAYPDGPHAKLARKLTSGAAAAGSEPVP